MYTIYDSPVSTMFTTVLFQHCLRQSCFYNVYDSHISTRFYDNQISTKFTTVKFIQCLRHSCFYNIYDFWVSIISATIILLRGLLQSRYCKAYTTNNIWQIFHWVMVTNPSVSFATKSILDQGRNVLPSSLCMPEYMSRV